MPAALTAVEKLFRFTNETETYLRFFKAGETWIHLGSLAASQLQQQQTKARFDRCEKWMMGITATQNILRLFKAAELFVKMRRLGAGVKAGDWIHHTLTYLSPVTLGLVAAAGFMSFLGKEQMIGLSPQAANNVSTFCKYGGGLWGNALASFGGFYAAHDLYHLDRIVDADKNFLGGAKYGLDFVASGLENLPAFSGIPGLAALVFTLKGVSRHVAVAQSFTGSYGYPVWTTVRNMVGRAA